MIRDGDIIPSKLRVIIYDEADLALEQSEDEDLNALRETEYFLELKNDLGIL